LVLSIPGQSPYELVPVRGTRFDLKGMPGFSVEFKQGPAGKVTEFVLYQPDASLVARRR
jgi:hypothetical protein